MKSLKKIFTSLVIGTLLLASSVNASEENVVSVNDSDSLINCLTKETSATCKLTENVALETTSFVKVPAGSDIILDLNGKSLSLPDIGYNYPLVVKGKLTIDGNGTINMLGGYGIQASLDSELLIKNGTFNQEIGSYIIGNFGTTTIEGGTFNGDYCTVNSFEYNGVNHYITIKGGNFNANDLEVILGDIIVEGGTFNQNIADIKAENYSDTDFVITIADGYKLKEEANGFYTVYKKNGVTINPTTNGTVEIDSTETSFIVGETVTLKITPNTGYELSEITIVDKEGLPVPYTNNTFTMPNEEVIVTVTFKESDPIVELPIVDPEQPVEDVKVGATDAVAIEEVLLDTLKDSNILDNLTNQQEIKVSLEVNALEQEAISDEIKDAIKNLAGNDKISNYFDVSVAIRNAQSGELLGNLSTLKEKIELLILLPEELKNTNKNIKRTYYVIRRHLGDNNQEILEKIPATLSDDGSTLSFETDQFSTYALAYNDATVTNVNNPQTFDGLTSSILLGTISLIGIAALVVYLKKEKFVKAN